MTARQDDTFRRLRNDSAVETWVENKSPKWHAKCRNIYLNEKSYKLAEKKHPQSSSSPLAGQKCSTPPSTSPPISTRNRTQTFDANACVICNKRWMKGKEPTCKVATDSSQQAIVAMANKLKREDILLRLIGQGHDMVANGICYHAPCMNAFKATRIPTGKSVQQNMYDIAFNRLVMQLEVPLFEEKRGVLVKSVRDQYRAIFLELGVKLRIPTSQ